MIRQSDPAALAASPTLNFATGRSLVLHHHPEEALPWLLRAQSLAGPDIPLLARSTWEIGCIHLDGGELAAAEIALANAAAQLGDGERRPPDLAHLAALLHEGRGELSHAEEQYRYAIAHSARALTPYTRVGALRNLAAALCHRRPDEAASFCGLGLAIIDADRLDPRLRPSLLNILCYALLCVGRIDDARQRGQQAVAEAERVGAARVGLYARFNLAIAHELSGDLEASARALQEVSGQLARSDELRGWCAIRLAWIASRSGDTQRAREVLDSTLEAPAKRIYAESLGALDATIGCLAGTLHQSIGQLRSAIVAYEERGDLLTTFALRLWLAYAYERTGRHDACIRTVHAALSVGQSQRFRLSPNYWHPVLVDIARRHASPELQRYAASLLAPAATVTVSTVQLSVVRIDGGDLVSIDEAPIDAARWRVGRTGSKVLRRLFALVAAAYPTAIHRDELIDLLWPDSDGDRAIANLYSATNDLRHFLTGIPGLVLEFADGGYRLRAEKNVEFIIS